MEKSAGVTIRVLLYLLTDDAKYVYQDQIPPGTRAREIDMIWKYVLHALVRRFLTDGVMKSAYNEVTSAEQ